MQHNDYMQRAMDLAEQAIGRTSPNPFVGAVIVRNDEIIGEGHTQPCGEDHAEVVALKEAGRKARGADMYVTLEPCCHWGRTPPCTDAIIKAGIKRVFIGIEDPNPKVCDLSGDILRKEGIEVTTGLMRDAIRRQLRPYLVSSERKRPYITLKIAASLDGRIAAQDGSSRWITGEESRKLVHQMRNRSDCILTGSGTVLADDPMLNVRLDGDCGTPVRAILDRRLRTLCESRIITTAATQPTWIFTDPGTPNTFSDTAVELIPHKSLQDVFASLYERGIMMVMVEAGPTLVTALLQQDLCDRIVIFYGNTLLGGPHTFIQSPLAATISSAKRWTVEKVEMVGEDVVVEMIV